MRISVYMSRLQYILGLVLIGLHLLILPLLLAWINLFLPHPLTLGQLNIAVFIGVYILTLFIFGRFLWKNLQNARRNLIKCLLTTLAGLGIYFAGSLAASFLIEYLNPDFINVNDDALRTIAQENYVWLWICTVLLVPVSEECMYRGVLLQWVYRRNRILGYVVSILLFAAIHVVGYIGTADALTLMLCFVQYIPAGFALTWAYEAADSIWAPILIHMIINGIGMFAMR